MQRTARWVGGLRGRGRGVVCLCLCLVFDPRQQTEKNNHHGNRAARRRVQKQQKRVVNNRRQRRRHGRLCTLLRTLPFYYISAREAQVLRTNNVYQKSLCRGVFISAKKKTIKKNALALPRPRKKLPLNNNKTTRVHRNCNTRARAREGRVCLVGAPRFLRAFFRSRSGSWWCVPLGRGFLINQQTFGRGGQVLGEGTAPGASAE